MWWCLVLILGTPEDRSKETYRIGHSDQSIQVDGVIDPNEWKNALVLYLDYEVQPGENVTPPVKTEMHLLLTPDGFAVAFRCFDDHPEQIRARYNNHDDLFSDDWVGIMLDTYNDQRRAFEFVVNPFGTQMDAINDEVGGNYDTSWNAIWDSKGHITDQGWEVELLVPYHQLRFPPHIETWGFDAFRSYPRAYRHHIGLWPRQRGANSYLGQADKITGLANLEPGANMELIPTVTSFRSEQKSQPNGSFDRDSTETDLGASFRWGITPNLSLNATVNPDFSQVEADAIQLDVNEQFALFFPETRPFFLEGADTYSTPIRLLHTRSVADPKAAIKLSGKKNAHTFGTFIGKDRITNLILPGPQGSRSASLDFETTAFVGRYRYDFGSNSTAGAMVTDRQGDGYHNTVISADLFYRFTDADQVTVNLARSDSEYNQEAGAALGIAPGVSLSDEAYHVSYRHSVRDWWARASYEHYGERFHADLGFQPQTGIKRAIAGIGRNWYFETWNRVEVGGDWDLTTQENGDLIEREYEVWLYMAGPLQSEINGGIGVRDRVFDGVQYDQDFQWLSLSATPWSQLKVSVSANRSDWIDFAQNREVDQLNGSINSTLRLGRHLNLTAAYSKSQLDLPQGVLLRTEVPELRMIYNFNEHFFVRWVGQYFQIERPQLQLNQEDWLNQVLLAYKLNPQTVAYLGYTDHAIGDDDLPLTQVDRSLFLKLGYAWIR